MWKNGDTAVTLLICLSRLPPTGSLAYAVSRGLKSSRRRDSSDAGKPDRFLNDPAFRVVRNVTSTSGVDGAGELDGAALFVPYGVEDGGGLVSIISTPHLHDTCAAFPRLPPHSGWRGELLLEPLLAKRGTR
jgi:hypothetical protein